MSARLPLRIVKEFDPKPPEWYRYVLSERDSTISGEFYKIKMRIVYKKHCWDNSEVEGYCSVFNDDEDEFPDNIRRRTERVTYYLPADKAKPYLCRWQQKTECSGSRWCSLYDEYTVTRIKHLHESS